MAQQRESHSSLGHYYIIIDSLHMLLVYNICVFIFLVD